MYGSYSRAGAAYLVVEMDGHVLGGGGVAAVTLAQVRDAWKRRLSLAALSQVRVGPKPAP